MYTLRTVSEDGNSNVELGNSYTLIQEEVHQEAFEKLSKIVFGEVSENVFAFVLNSEGEAKPLYRVLNYYIVTENGSTFAHPHAYAYTSEEIDEINS